MWDTSGIGAKLAFKGYALVFFGVFVSLLLFAFSFWLGNLSSSSTIGLQCFRFFSPTWSFSSSGCFFALAALAHLFPKISYRFIAIAIPVCLAVGTIAIVFCQFDSLWSERFSVISGLGLGLAVALVQTRWIQVFATIQDRAVRIIILSACLVGVLPHLLLPRLLGTSSGIIGAVVVLAIANSTLILFAGRLLVKPLPSVVALSAAEKTEPSVPHDRTSQLLNSTLLLCACVLSLIAPFINNVILSNNLLESTRIAFSQAGSVAAVVILSLVWFVARRPLSIERLYMFALPILIVSLFVAPFFSVASSYLLLFLGATSFLLITILTMTVSLERASQSPEKLIVIYGVLSGVVFLSCTFGEIVSKAIASSRYSYEIQTLTAVFFLIYVVSVAGYFIFRGGGASQGLVDKNKSPKKTGDSFAPQSTALLAEQLASRYGLSKREQEVAELLLHGHSYATVAERLYLSQNTVRTYAKSLYKALKIHSRQELIILVESLGQS